MWCNQTFKKEEGEKKKWLEWPDTRQSVLEEAWNAFGRNGWFLWNVPGRLNIQHPRSQVAWKNAFMALTKPILYSTVAFDASDTHRFTFNVVSGDQVVKNRLTIVNQNTNIVVYDEEQITYAYYHDVPSNILTNGEYYYAFINTYNINGVKSPPSNNIQFY